MPRNREPGTPCRIYVDGMPSLEVGHFITTEGGSGYWVQGMRPSPSKWYRRYLQCVRVRPSEIPADAVVHRLTWYRRESRNR
jgi:hypothetical protein